MMRTALFAVVIGLPAIAAAQDASDQTGSINPANPILSLNEDQVRHCLEKSGYTAIGSLDRDADGIWRTTAMRGDEMMSIAVNRNGLIEDR
jgi:hypothetical protein